MAIVIKSVTTVTGPGPVTVPASTAVGDLLLFYCSSFSSNPVKPSDFTSIYDYVVASGSYVEQSSIAYKIAVSGDIGTSKTFSNVNNTYSANVLMVISGHDQTNPINAFNSGVSNGGTTCSTNTVVTNKPARRFMFFAEMANTNTPTFTASTSGGTQQASDLNSNGYHAVYAYSADATENAGTLPSYSSSSSTAGGITGIAVAVQQANSAPTITSTSPTTFADNRTAPVRISWTYSDVESNTQYKYEVGYRVKGTSTWTTVTNTTANAYYDIPTATLTLGTEYEYQVRIDDNQGGGWSSYATGSFVAGTSAWTNGSQVSSSTQSTTIDTTGLAPGTYYVQVRTADAVDFGPWSANQTFVVTPLGNVWVRTGGTWVQMKNNVKVSGTFKQVPPTKKNTGGVFN